MKLFGIEFASILWTPLERRLQTLAVLYFNFSFFLLGLTGIFFLFIFLFTPLFFLPLLYFAWFVYDFRTPEQGSRPWEGFRHRKIWSYFRDYFPMKLHKTAELETEKNYLLLYHPHGITSCGAFLNFCTEATGVSKLFPGFKFRLLVLPMQFYLPISREYGMIGGVCSASKRSMEYLMSKCGKNNAIILVVGGANEALEANPGNFNLYLRKRKGFIKLALKHGTPLVPVYSFGEADLYVQLPSDSKSFLRKLQDLFTRFFTFSPPLFHGRGIFNYTFGFLPFRRPCNVVVGKPLDVERIDDPTYEQINFWHEKYVKHLETFFEEQKLKYGLKAEDHLNVI